MERGHSGREHGLGGNGGCGVLTSAEGRGRGRGRARREGAGAGRRGGRDRELSAAVSGGRGDGAGDREARLCGRLLGVREGGRVHGLGCRKGVELAAVGGAGLRRDGG